MKLDLEISIDYTSVSKNLNILAKAGILYSTKIGGNHFFIDRKMIKILSK